MNKYLRLLCVIIAALSVTKVALSAQAEKSSCSVSIPEQSGRTMVFAGGELCRYLKAMTGKDVRTVGENRKGGSPIVRLDVEPGLHHDGYHIRRYGKTIHIGGGSPRGCLYGAYMFLRELGCRWPLPGEENEIVPRLDEISYRAPEIKTEPAIAGRGICVCTPIDSYCIDYLLELIDFLAKNRFNFLFVHTSNQLVRKTAGLPPEYLTQLQEALTARDMGFQWGGHWLAGYLPRDLFAKHPEYFRMENGKRTPHLNLCPASSEALDIMARNSLEEWEGIKALPRFETLHLWLDDVVPSGWCSCEKCTALAASDQALKVTNEIAERLPLGKTKLAYLVYQDTILPPRSVRPSDRVRLLYAPRERCYRHALGECEANRFYLDCLKGHLKVSPHGAQVFEYYHDMMLYRCLPMPLHPTIGKDVKIYREAGVTMISSLAFVTFSDWAYGSNYHVLSRALWRGEGKPEDIEEYCADVYGPAAQAMKRYFDLLFELCATAVTAKCGYDGFVDMVKPPYQPYSESHIAKLAPLLSKEHLDRIEGIIARAMAEAGEPYRTRIADQLILWKAARLDVRAIYEMMLAMHKSRDVLAGRAAEADRRGVVGLISQSLRNMTRAGEILLSAPQPLRGPLICAPEIPGVLSNRMAPGGPYKMQLETLLKKLGSIRPDVHREN